MARRQEQESARDTVTEVGKGVLRMELPIRLPGLGHVNCYAILDGDGAAIVDPGLPGPGTWKVLHSRLKQAGLAPHHIHSVIVTHSHPDHFGGASRWAREVGAKVIGHHRFSFGPFTPANDPDVCIDELAVHHRHAHGDEDDRDDDVLPEALESAIAEANSILESTKATGKTPWGGEHDRGTWWRRLRFRAMQRLGRGIVPTITAPVEHGDVLRLAGREWFVIHTPGHTGDHICLHDPESRVLLSGDHVLPTITPHIGGTGSSPDPLASFFYSLDRVAEIQDVENVLPAHGHPFEDLPGRAQAIKRHHEERLETVRDISREFGQPVAVRAFSERLFKPRSWGSMAESETYAHLEHLRIKGDAERVDGPNGRFLYITG